MASGRINLQANDGKVAGIVFEDGASANVAVTVPKDGGKLAADSSVVHKTGDETIAGIKSFSDGVKVQNQNVSPFSGFKNYIINGAFDVWQYGTSQTSPGYGSDDRWQNVNVVSTKTHLRVACTDTERALFNASYFSRTVVSSVIGAEILCVKAQRIEDVTKLAGKLVTLSFWAKADANKNIAIEFEQLFGAGGSPSAGVTTIGSQLVALTTTWQKKTITLTIPSIVGKTLGTDGSHTSALSVNFWFEAGSNFSSRSANLGQQSGTFDIAQVQLEEGSIATPFEQRPYGLELSLCQRYYEISPYLASLCIPASSSYLGGIVPWVFKQTKRTTPTITITTNNGSKTTTVQQLTSNGCTFVPTTQSTLVADYITLTAIASSEL